MLQDGKVTVAGMRAEEEWREVQPRDSSHPPNGSVAYVGALGMTEEIVPKKMLNSQFSFA